MSAFETMMPPVQYADVNGIRMAYYEAGPREGIPVVFLHGFPEIAFSWRHQIKALADAGRWVIAPDQRGYGLTSRPKAVEDYDMEHLAGDLIALLDHLGIEKAIFAGHDWGGIILWQMPLRYPDRVAGAIGLNTPFMARGPADPIAIMRARLGEEMYIVHFQKPGEADAVLDENPRKAMQFFMRRPMPAVEVTPDPSGGVTQAVSQGGVTGAPERAEGESVFPLIKILQMYDGSFDPRPPLLTDEEMDAFVETFERTGFTGGINWYRNFTRNWERSADVPTKVTCPGLMVMAELDAVLPPSAADGMETYVPDLEKVLIKGSGHWTQQEKPEEVNQAILGWLDKRFPK
ncbi:MAG: alpha/beta hydrolase [Caulobacteraceae bacterium]